MKVNKKTKIVVVVASFALLGVSLMMKPAHTKVYPAHKPLAKSNVKIVEDADGDGEVSKGDMISIHSVTDGEKNVVFRVISNTGNFYKLLSMDRVDSISTATSYNIIRTDGKYISSYSNSNIDDMANEYYESLPGEVQQAIIPQMVKQSIYKFEYGDDEATKTCSGKYLYLYESADEIMNAAKMADRMKLSVMKTGETKVGERYVYAPDLDEIIDYIGSSRTPETTRTAMYGTDEISIDFLATRTAVDDFPDRIAIVNQVTGNFADVRTNVTVDFHPEFVIELK